MKTPNDRANYLLENCAGLYSNPQWPGIINISKQIREAEQAVLKEHLPPCDYKPNNVKIGQHHCPKCGTMMVGGIPHGPVDVEAWASMKALGIIKALEFYEGEVEALARHLKSKTDSYAIDAVIAVLSLDGGERAKKALDEYHGN